MTVQLHRGFISKAVGYSAFGVKKELCTPTHVRGRAAALQLARRAKGNDQEAQGMLTNTWGHPKRGY